jgi:hypothetical protein
MATARRVEATTMAMAMVAVGRSMTPLYLSVLHAIVDQATLPN